MRSAPVLGSRAWKWTMAAPASAHLRASTAPSSADTGTFGFSAFVDCSLIAASMISFSLRSNMPPTLMGPADRGALLSRVYAAQQRTSVRARNLGGPVVRDAGKGERRMGETTLERYTIISSDGHAGADLLDYKPYLAARWHDEFDAWAAAYENPFADLLAPTAYRNWESERRPAELHSDGIAAEVLFPNTVPPFFQQSNLTALPPTAEDYERRWAGAQAHNRWL